MKRPVLLLTTACLWAIGTPASAQTLYRCGNTYSQTPCSPGAAAVKARGNAAPDAAPGLQGAELCSATAMRTLDLDEAGPVQIGSVVKGQAEVIQYADKPTATRKYLVSLKVKGAYAAYDGPRSFVCHLSEDERRVLKFAATR